MLRTYNAVLTGNHLELREDTPEIVRSPPRSLRYFLRTETRVKSKITWGKDGKSTRKIS